MIDANLFAERWQIMLARFNRDLDPDEANRYYRYLGPKLDGIQFVAASEKLWAESTRWPKPADYVDAAPPSSRLVLAPGEDARDPYWQPIHRVLRNSQADRAWRVTTHARREASTIVLDDSGPPFFFPRPIVELVDSQEEVGLTWIERSDLRIMFAGE